MQIGAPTAGATVTGTVTVTGTASDNAGLSRVDVRVDGGSNTAATGTTSWSKTVNTTGYSDGNHTITATAVDTSGNTTSNTVSVTFDNTPEPVADATAPSVSISAPSNGSTVSGAISVTGASSDNASVSAVDVRVDSGSWQRATGTTSWNKGLDTSTYADGAHSITSRATDSSGNTSTVSRSVTFDNTPEPPSSPAPNTQGTWTSPEGARIEVNTTGSWTIASVYTRLRDNAAGPGDFSVIAPKLVVKVQDTYSTMAYTSASTSGGVYANFSATIYLKGNSTAFSSRPDDNIAHEYGHVWTEYHRYMTQQGSWTKYVNKRWASVNGATVIGQDSRLDSGHSWSKGEIIADDYRLLFGTATAISQRSSHLNSDIPDPRNQAGLRTWLLDVWAG